MRTSLRTCGFVCLALVCAGARRHHTPDAGPQCHDLSPAQALEIARTGNGQSASFAADSQTITVNGTPVCSVERYFTAVRAVATGQILRSDRYQITVGFGLLSAGDRVLVSLGTECDELQSDAADSDHPEGDQEQSCDSEETFSVRSFVGPIVSWDLDGSGDSTGEIYPQHWVERQTIDLRTGKAPDVEALVDGASWAEQLELFDHVARREDPDWITDAGYHSNFDWSAGRMAIEDYDPDLDRVLLSFVDGRPSNQPWFDEMELWVKPSDSFRPALLAAKQGHGVFADGRNALRSAK